MNITLEVCHELLKAKFGSKSYEIIDFDIQPSSEDKYGFMCEHDVLKVRVRYEGATRQENFFVKSLPLNEVQKYVCVETKSCAKEELMFTNIVPTFLKHDVNIIENCIPHCYLVRPNQFIVLDDLTSTGYKMLSTRESMSFAAVKVALNSIAKFHASCLILEEKLTTDLTKPYVMYDNFRAEFSESFYSSLKPCIEYIESSKETLATQINYFADDTWKITQDLFKKRAQKILDDFEEFAQPSKIFRNTICHGDIWANNLMFKFEDADPTHCVLIDFQSYRYCPPAQDVMAFIYLSTDDDFRKKYMSESLDHYYDQLGRTLGNYDIEIEKILSRPEFTKSCEYYEIFAVAQAVSHFHNIMITPTMLKEILEIPGYTDVVFGGDRSGCFLEMCAKDDGYKEKNRQALENLRILCEKIHD